MVFLIGVRTSRSSILAGRSRPRKPSAFVPMGVSYSIWPANRSHLEKRRLFLAKAASVSGPADEGLEMTELADTFGVPVERVRGESETWLAFLLGLKTPLITSPSCGEKPRGSRNFSGDV